jgi:hypothetical protein
MGEDSTPKKGTTRLAILIVFLAALLIGFVVGKYALFAESEDLKDLVMMVVGALLSAFGVVVAYYFGEKAK